MRPHGGAGKVNGGCNYKVAMGTPLTVVVKANFPLVDGFFTMVQLFTNCQLLLKLGKFPYSSNKKGLNHR